MHSEHTKGKQQSAAVPSPASSQGVASRILGIPELLENILVESAATDVGESDRALSVKDLFVWQRVNCTFRNTIRELPKLRQYMMLERSSKSIAPDPDLIRLDNMGALQAAFGDHRIQQRGWYDKLPADALSKDTYDMPLMEVGERSTRTRSWEKVHLSEAVRRQSATWRNMKLWPVDGDFRIRQWVTDNRRSNSLAVNGRATLGCIYEISVKHEMTLGDFVEVLTKLHARAPGGHMEKFICFFVSWHPHTNPAAQLRHSSGDIRLPDQNVSNHIEAVEASDPPFDSNAK